MQETFLQEIMHNRKSKGLGKGGTQKDTNSQINIFCPMLSGFYTLLKMALLR